MSCVRAAAAVDPAERPVDGRRRPGAAAPDACAVSSARRMPLCIRATSHPACLGRSRASGAGAGASADPVANSVIARAVTIGSMPPRAASITPSWKASIWAASADVEREIEQQPLAVRRRRG